MRLEKQSGPDGIDSDGIGESTSPFQSNSGLPSPPTCPSAASLPSAQALPSTQALPSPPAGASQLHMLASRLKRMMDADINTLLAKHSTLSLPEWRILAVLRDGTAPMGQKELVARIGFAQGQTSRSVDALRAGGLILTRHCTTDRRSRQYRISPQGLVQFNAFLPYMEERRDALEGVLNPAEIGYFETAAAKLLEALEARQNT